MTHTPGPWMLEPYSDEDETIYVCANYSLTDEGFARATWIAECDLQDGNLEENAANARLIAAAPELLDACKRLLKFNEELAVDVRVSTHYPSAECARAAIAKAEGRS